MPSVGCGNSCSRRKAAAYTKQASQLEGVSEGDAVSKPDDISEVCSTSGVTASTLEQNSHKYIQKHDSGICIDRSNEEYCSSDESGSSIQNSIDKACTSCEQKEQNSPDSGHQEPFQCSAETLSSEKTEPSDEDSEELSAVLSRIPVCELRKLNKLGKKSLDYLSADTNSNSSETVEEKMDASSQVVTSPPVIKTKKPPHKWFICNEVLGRQYGTSSRYYNDLFRFRCCGSLHMVERLELMYKMERHKGCVNTLHFNQTGTKLVSGSDDLDIIIWDWTVAEPLLVYDSGHRTNIFQAKFMPLSGDLHIVSCARDGQVRIAELSGTGVCKNTRRLAQHRGAAHKLTVEQDSPHFFLSCGEDAVVFEIDIRESKPQKLTLCKEKDRKVPLYSIFSNPSNVYEFATGGRDHFVRIYDKRFIREDGPCKKFCPHHLVNSDVNANITCLVYNYNGSEILASYNDDDIYTFDSSHSDGADCTNRYIGHRNNQTVKGVNYFGLQSEFIVSGSDCGHIYFWEHDSQHILQYLYGDVAGVVNCLECHPNCPILATSGLDEDIKIWVPSCETDPDLSGLQEKVCSNLRNREEERKEEATDTIDGQMLWFLMQQWCRRIRHSGRETDASSSSNNESDSDEDDDNPAQCPQS